MDIHQFKNAMNFVFTDDDDLMQMLKSSKKYIEDSHAFLFRPNRLNVMISCAKTKVIIFPSNYILGQ